MYVSDCITINGNGNLAIGGADTVELAKEYGTPVYVFDENEIRKNLRAFKNSMDEYYGGNGLVVYASKAFCCKEMCRICKQEGTGIGLSLSRQIMRLHNGSLNLTRSDEKGTVFTLIFR